MRWQVILFAVFKLSSDPIANSVIEVLNRIAITDIITSKFHIILLIDHSNDR